MLILQIDLRAVFVWTQEVCETLNCYVLSKANRNYVIANANRNMQLDKSERFFVHYYLINRRILMLVQTFYRFRQKA